MQETSSAIDNPAALSHSEECHPVPASLGWAEDSDPAALSQAKLPGAAAPTALWYWAENSDSAALP